MSSTTAPSTHGTYTFAGVMLLVLGAFNVIDGFALLQKAAWFEDKFIASNADTWGWILIVFAIAQLAAGFMLLNGSGGRTMAITVASISMVLWFSLLFVVPFAALLAVGINFSIIASVLSTDPA
jgi:hypothetical protein